MNVTTIGAVLAVLVFAIALVLALIWFCKWSCARLKAAVRKCGLTTVAFFFIWGALLADSQNVTQEEKERMLEQETASDPDSELSDDPEPGSEDDDSGDDLPDDAPGLLFALAPLHLAGDTENRPGAIVLPIPAPVELPPPALQNSPVYTADLWVSNFTHTVSQSVARVVYTNATLAFAGVPIPRRRVEAIVASTLADGGDWSYYTNVTPWSVNMMSSHADFVFPTNALPSYAVTNCFFGFGANVDSDSDGISDLAEMYLYRTDPFSADTDGDGDPDGLEISNGTDPHDPSDGLFLRGRTAEWYVLNYPGVLSVVTNSHDEVVVDLANVSQTNIYYNLYLTPRLHSPVGPVTVENENGLAPDGASFVLTEGVTNVIPLRVGQSYLFSGIHLGELDFAADDPYVVVGTDGGSSFTACRPVRILLTDVPPPEDAQRCGCGHVHARYCHFETDPSLTGDLAVYDTDCVTVDNVNRRLEIKSSGMSSHHGASYYLDRYGALGTFSESDGPVDLVFDDLSPYSLGGNVSCFCGTTSYCPDCIGSTVAWYNLMFPDLLTATNASDGSVSFSWRDGVASNAYHFVDLTTTNKSIRVTVTPRVPTAQGAYQVQLLAGMTARVPLLRGVTYDLVGNADDLGFSTFEEDVTVTQTSNRAYAVERPLSYELWGSTQTDTACASGHIHARHYRITTGVPDIPGTLEFDDTKCFTPVGPNEFVAECDGLKGAMCPTNDVVTGRFIYEGVTNSFAITNSTLCRCDNLHHPTCPCGADSLCGGCDTTIYGQDEYWVRANIDRLRELDPAVTNAEDILTRGYLNWVNDRVGYGLLNGLYMLTATFEEPPSVPTQLRVGDYVVSVTNAGFYAFLLEKGVDYYFDTYPRVPDVIYSTRDDLAAPPMTTSLETEVVGQPGVWTRDGGEKELTAPSGNDRGHTLQMPTLTATPDIAHLGPTDLPVSFTAVLSDFFAMNNVAFLWTSADSNLNIVTPTDVSTAVSATSIPDWEEFQLTVSANVYGHTLESVLMQSYYGFLESRPVYQDVLSLALLTSGGDEIPWSSPVLDGEDMRMRIVLSEPSDDISEFVAKYSGALSLRTYSVDDDGDHLISERIVPLSAGDVELRTSCEFDVLLHAAWLRSAGLVSKAEDAWQEKTSLDMSASVTGLSQRVDSDTIDGLSGLLRGRVRGEGDETSSVPEGVFNDRYLKSAGYVMMVAECGIRVSQPKPVQQQADRVYYSGHGSHASAKLMNKYGPSELATHWEDVDVLVIAGCAVLDIKDYRSSSFNMFAKRKWEKKGGACSPGVQWESMGLDVYLGYAWYAPRDSEGGNDIAARYKANILSGQDCIVAWRNANDCDEGRNACAIDCRTTPHIFWYWEESAFGGCVWTSITKGGVGW